MELQEPKIRISTTVKLLKTFSQMNFVSPFGFMLILFHIFVCLLFACVFLLFVFLFYFAPLWPTASQRSSPSSRCYSRRTCAASCCCLARSFRSPATPGLSPIGYTKTHRPGSRIMFWMWLKLNGRRNARSTSAWLGLRPGRGI